MSQHIIFQKIIKKLFNGGGVKPGETNLVLLFDILLHFLVPHKLYVPVI